MLSRLYTPEQYGEFGVFVSVLSIVNSILFLSYENTIIKSNREKDLLSLVTLCLLISGLVIMLTAAVFIVGDFIDIYFFSNFNNVILLVLVLSSSSILGVLRLIENRYNNYGRISYTNITVGVVQSGSKVFFGSVVKLWDGLIFGNLFGQLSGSLFLILFRIKSIHKLRFKKVSFQHMMSLAAEYKKFPIYDAPAKLLEFSILNLVLIILSSFFSESEIGYYSMVLQLVLLPVGLIGSAIGSVYFRELSGNPLTQTNIQSSTRRVLRITFILSILPSLFFIFGGDFLLVWLLGPNWGPSGKIALILSVFSMPVILSQPVLPALKVLDKQEVRLKVNFMALVLSLGSIVITLNFFEEFISVILVYSIVYTLTQFYLLFKILKFTNVNYGSMFPKAFAISVVTYVLLAVRLYYVF